MRIAVLLATLAVFWSANSAWSADSSLRIQRPNSSVVSKQHSVENVSASHARFCTTGGGTPICSTDESKLHVENHTCCDITSKYFPIKIAGPSQHFGLWLRLNLYPTLCHSVLCQRQCALNGYESCNALGGERNLIEQVIANYGDCSGESSSGSCCDTNESSVSVDENNQTTSVHP